MENKNEILEKTTPFEDKSNKENNDSKKKKSNKKLVAIIVAIVACIGLGCYFCGSSKKEELSKDKYMQGYEYSMSQTVEKFDVKVIGNKKKNGKTYFQCTFTPKSNSEDAFSLETTKKPTEKTITGSKYIYTISYGKTEEVTYSYYSNEYGKSITDKELKKLNSSEYIDKYYSDHFVEPSK